MTELNASIQLNRFLIDNEITEISFIGYVGHRENKIVYGGLFWTHRGLLLQLHKWKEINKNKTAPKVCAEIQYTCKFTTAEIFESFKIIDDEEYRKREILDMQTV